MKTIYIITAILLGGLCFSQEIIPLEEMEEHLPYTVNGRYFKDINHQLDKFLGTWKYEDDTQIPTKALTVTFFKNDTDTSRGYRKDYLYASYIYTENGATIYDTTQLSYPFIVGGMFRDSSDTNTYSMLYGEPEPATEGYRYSFKLHFIPTSPNTLQWDVTVTAEVGENPQLPRIPQHITLVKQP